MTVPKKLFDEQLFKLVPPEPEAKPVCLLTKAQREILLDPEYLSKAVGMFWRKRGHIRPYSELVSEAADFILTAYKAPVIDMKRSRKDNQRAALEAHAAVSIYHRLLRVCSQFDRNPDEHMVPMSDLSGPLAAPEAGEPTQLGPEAASRQLELLQAMLEYDEHWQALKLREFLVAFSKKLDAKIAARSIGMTGTRLTGLFRWARQRYSGVLG